MEFNIKEVLGFSPPVENLNAERKRKKKEERKKKGERKRRKERSGKTQATLGYCFYISAC